MMLDKTVPYAKVLMRRPKGTPMPDLILPAGFTLTLFTPGDETVWAAIETSVEEFDREDKALSYFQEEFLPQRPELEKRCLFIENETGEKIATGMAWWYEAQGKREPRLHWVAVKPGYQGLGLGKAIAAAVTHKLLELEGDMDFFLSTQTWSYKAIRIYEKAGYAIIAENALGVVNEDYDKAMAVLARVAGVRPPAAKGDF